MSWTRARSRGSRRCRLRAECGDKLGEASTSQGISASSAVDQLTGLKIGAVSWGNNSSSDIKAGRRGLLDYQAAYKRSFGRLIVNGIEADGQDLDKMLVDGWLGQWL